MDWWDLYYDAPPAGGSSGGSSSGSGGAPNCDQLALNTGLAGLTYQSALRIWVYGNLDGYQTDSSAAVIAALAAVTWQGESSFSLAPINNPNKNAAGVTTSVDYGPFQINQGFHPNGFSGVWGTTGGGQTFNGSANANIGFGVTILEGLYGQYGNNAAGRYVGSLGNWKTTTDGPNGHLAGTPINPSAQKREGTWNQYSGALEAFFSNTYCFTHI